MLRRFLKSRSGNLAIMSGLLIVPLCLAVGFAIDYSRYLAAERHLQEMADNTSLALAISRERDSLKLEAMAGDFLKANHNAHRVEDYRLVSIEADENEIDLSVEGSIPTTFMTLAGYERLNVAASSLTSRASFGNVEVSLILDNTSSMETRAGGVRRIDALKSAANELIDAVLSKGSDDESYIRVALVPYGDNVNVGAGYAGASWISHYREQCSGILWWVTCDWVTSAAQNGSQRFHGCVGSRMGNVNRLDVGNPNVRYPGYVTSGRECVTPLVRLTDDKQALKTGIDQMVTRLSGNGTVYTYIPSGLMWGYNTLVPDGPFGDGKPYEQAPGSNEPAPRKVAVLMTDGANTRSYDKNSGVAVGSPPGLTQAERQPWVKPATCFGSTTGCYLNPVGSGSMAQANEDTLAICTNMKAKGIEVFTVAFEVNDGTAKDMLKLCASSQEHYFEADDSQRLSDAFRGIASSLQVVRLSR